VGRAVIRYATSTYQREMVEQKLHDDLLRTLRETLAPAALTRLMKEGETLNDEEAARLALR